MDKFALDYRFLEKEINKPKYFKYNEVKDRLIRVAFDVVRFMDCNDDIDGLWQIQKTDDGEVIVAKYEDSPQNIDKQASDSSWHVIPDKANTSINIFYKNSPIKRIASIELGIDSNYLPYLCKDTEVKLASDSSFREKLLRELPLEQQTELLNQFPELAQ